MTIEPQLWMFEDCITLCNPICNMQFFFLPWNQFWIFSNWLILYITNTELKPACTYISDWSKHTYPALNSLPFHLPLCHCVSFLSPHTHMQTYTLTPWADGILPNLHSQRYVHIKRRAKAPGNLVVDDREQVLTVVSRFRGINCCWLCSVTLGQLKRPPTSSRPTNSQSEK